MLIAINVCPLQRFYYFAIVEDFVLRFGWTLSMSLIENGYIQREIMLSILAPLEVFRRFVWNYFRLENEHLNNCGRFRAVRDISVAPMDSSDQVGVIDCFDSDLLGNNNWLVFLFFPRIADHHSPDDGRRGGRDEQAARGQGEECRGFIEQPEEAGRVKSAVGRWRVEGRFG